MSDLFISYSREDTAFVRKLVEALQEDGRQVWVDWEGIPPTAEWMAEIYAAIEAANTFLYVLSPASVNSEVAGLELTHAIAHNKRLVPIVCRDIKAADTHETVRAINWIFFREEDSFDEALKKLTEALDTDLEWVTAHTRLLVRAVEWDDKGRNNAFLLRGDDLQEAEGWLAQGAMREPPPTVLQAEYITSSRQEATRRSRLTLTAVSGGLALTLVLCIAAVIGAIIAFNQSRIARSEEQARATQQFIAEEQATIANSRALAFQSGIALQNASIGEAYQLAVESYQTYPSIESLRALYDVNTTPARYLPELTINSGGETLYRAAFSPDATTFATASGPNGVSMWDAQTGQRLWNSWSGYAVSAKFSPDGKQVVTANVDGNATIWDAETGDLLRQLEGHTGYLHYAEFSQDGRYVVTAAGKSSCVVDCDFSARVWDARTGEEIAVLSGHEGKVNYASFSPDGERVVTGSADGTARVWDIDTEQPVMTLTLPGVQVNVLVAMFDPEGSRIMTATSSGTVTMWDATTRDTLNSFDGTPGGSLFWADLSPRGNRVVTASNDSAARIFYWRSGEEIAELRHDDIVQSASFGADEIEVLTLSGDVSCATDCEFSASIWARNSPSVQVLDAPGAVARFSADGTRLAAMSFGSDAQGVVWDINNDEQVSALEGYDVSVSAISISADGKTVVAAPSVFTACGPDCDYVGRVWDATSGELLTLLEGHAGPVQAIDISPDGALAATASYDGTLRLWDLETGEQIGQVGEDMSAEPDVANYAFNDVTFSADGAWILAASAADDGVVYDAATLEVIRTLPHNGRVTAIAINPAGDLIATGLDSGDIFFWDAATGEQQATLAGHTGKVNKLAFSPDGTLLASGGSDDSARLWDVAQAAPLATLPHLSRVPTVDFNQDGTRLLTTDSASFVRLWVIAPDELVELSEQHLGLQRVVSAEPLFPDEGDAQLIIQPATGPIGTSHQLRFSGFAPNETVTMTITHTDSGDVTGLLPLEVDADGTGVLALQTEESDALGNYVIEIEGDESGLVASAEMTITPD